jgi:hypothetical protein
MAVLLFNKHCIVEQDPLESQVDVKLRSLTFELGSWPVGLSIPETVFDRPETGTPKDRFSSRLTPNSVLLAAGCNHKPRKCRDVCSRLGISPQSWD